MSDFVLDFIGDDEVQIKTGVGGPFIPSGMIAEWAAGIAYKLGGELDLAQEGVSFDEVSRSQRGWYTYYFRSQEKASEVATQYGLITPEQVWRLQARRETLANVASDVIERFSNVISADVSIRTFRSKKYRHAFHLIALPYAVQAAALRMGLLAEPVFHAGELLLPSREGEPDKFNDELHFKMIGNPDDPDAAAAEGMLNNELGRRRVELWKALGETNPLAWLPAKIEDAKLEKFVTTSVELDRCLAIFHQGNWKKTVWAEKLDVYDPRADAYIQNDPTKRLRIPVLYRLFKNEAEAREEGVRQIAEREARKAGAEGSAVASTNGTPTIPDEWRDMVGDFEAEFRRVVSDGKANALVAKTMSMTAEEVVAWKAYLQL